MNTAFFIAALVSGTMPITSGCAHPQANVVLNRALEGNVQGQSNLASHVAVVMNMDSAESEQIASYYVNKRHIPRSNVIQVHCPANESIPQADFNQLVLNPVKDAVHNNPNGIDYIVVTTGDPLVIKESGYSCDGELVGMDDAAVKPITALTDANIAQAKNPYFGADTPFSHSKFPLYLVCRLDGYTVADAKMLVDHSLAATASKGLFFFQQSPIRTAPGFGELQQMMTTASNDLTSRGFQTLVQMAKVFTMPSDLLMGYCTWGSNNGSFNTEAYDSAKFRPGAICETFVSTSGRTFRSRAPGQSRIADLIAAGVTGVKGYVTEPFTFSLCHPDILFGRYTSGYNLAESFYMASPVIKYKDVVIGDPLCAPYAKP